MTTALRRRLEALREMTTERGCTEHEAAAARAAELRIARRHGVGVEDLEPAEQYPPVPPGRRRTRGRRKTSQERPKQHRMHMGDVIDLDRWCRCGSARYEVVDAMALGHVAMLVCTGCGRGAGWSSREDFGPNRRR